MSMELEADSLKQEGGDRNVNAGKPLYYHPVFYSHLTTNPCLVIVNFLEYSLQYQLRKLLFCVRQFIQS